MDLALLKYVLGVIRKAHTRVIPQERKQCNVREGKKVLWELRGGRQYVCDDRESSMQDVVSKTTCGPRGMSDVEGTWGRSDYIGLKSI